MIIAELAVAVVGGIVLWVGVDLIHRIPLWWIAFAPSVYLILYISGCELLGALRRTRKRRKR